MMTRPLSILHIASEVAPYSQTGGLGDVTRDLPAIQRRTGMRSVVISPLYGCIKKDALEMTELGFCVDLGNHSFPVRIWRDETDTHWFVDVPGLLDRPSLYHNEQGDYPDNPLRFAVFCKAAVQLGSTFDCLHLHDWQSGLAALYNAGVKPTVISIHNLAYQGLCGFEWAHQLDIPEHLWGMEGVEFYGQVSLLKAGLVLANQIATVSPTYAEEIQSEPGGQGLSGLFLHRAGDLTGILNGLDHELWNPFTDPALIANFDSNSLMDREENRQHLFDQYQLEEGTLFCIVSRAATQKGLHLIIECLDELIAAGARFIWLTNGDPDIMKMIEDSARTYPSSFRLIPEFDPLLARRLYGGGDFVLVPSLYEPCGLTQMMAMRYGAVPIVRQTGGLADTVRDGDTGITFENVSGQHCRDAILRGIALKNDRNQFEIMQHRCMNTDHSWDRAHLSYEQMYHRLLRLHLTRA